MAWTWTNGNVAGTTVLPAYGDERSNAIKQLAADLYSAPANGGDGAGQLDYPLQELCPLADGIGTTAEAGVEVALSEEMDAVDDYRVEFDWQEDPGDDSGELYAVKETDKFTVFNNGSGYGKKFGYCAKKVVTGA